MLYNQLHEHYVLWFGGGGFPGTNVTTCAVSKSPVGPFTMVRDPVGAQPVAGQLHGTQVDFWVDTTITPHVAYMHHDIAGGSHSPGQAVTKLSDDFLHATPECVMTGGGFLDGGAIFERRGHWYMMAGTPCCLCDTGASAEVWMAPQPLGPWRSVGNIIEPVAPAANVTLCGFNRKDYPCSYEIKAQQFGILALGDDTRIYVGQRWGSATLKCHDGQYWGVLSFDESTGVPLQLRHKDTETVELPSETPWETPSRAH